MLASLASLASAAAGAASDALTDVLGGKERRRVIVVLACVLGLSGADTATVGASATELRHGLHVSNTDIGLLVTATALVGAVATLPFGVLADRVRRTTTLGLAIVLWAGAMFWSASVSGFHDLLVARLFLGAVTAAAGPLVASLVGDYFGGHERGRIYGFILTGELLGAGFGFAVTGRHRRPLVARRLRHPRPARARARVVRHAPARAEARRQGRARARDGASAGGRRRTRRTRPTRSGSHARAALEPDPELVLDRDPRRLNIVAATRYVLRIRTNIILVAASACGYYFLAGLQTFGSEFAKEQYGIGQALANLSAHRRRCRRGARRPRGRRHRRPAPAPRPPERAHPHRRRHRVAHGVFFIPAIATRGVATALPYLTAAAFLLSAQNPPLDAARLDIMPPLLWGRAEAVRTLLRSLAQALAPLLFGAVSDHVFGGGRGGLQWTFFVMLVPLAASAVLLWRARLTYPQDVATAAAGTRVYRRRAGERE